MDNKSIMYNGRELFFNCFDIEVYANFWEIRSERWSISSETWSQKEVYKVKSMILDEILVGYNIKNYDNIILNEVIFRNNIDTTYIKELSDNIINYQKGIYDINYWNKFAFIDLIDVVRNANNDKRIGLKSIAGNMGLNIIESSIHWDDDITLDNIALHDEYLDNDVAITRALFDATINLSEMKANLAETFNIDLIRAFKSTKAKIAQMVTYNGKTWESDESTIYQIPKELDSFVRENVPKTIVDFFTTQSMKDVKNMEFNDLFGNKGKIGKGGVHTYNDKFKYFNSKIAEEQDVKLFHDDFASQYPNIMINFEFNSRGIDLEKLVEIVNVRMEIKKELKDKLDDYALKKKYEAYKEVINSLFGVSLANFGDLADKERGFSVTFTGQLMIIAIAYKYYNAGFTILQANTDGIIAVVPNDKLDEHERLRSEAEEITGIEFESDEMHDFYQWNVNNYIEVEHVSNDYSEYLHIVDGYEVVDFDKFLSKNGEGGNITLKGKILGNPLANSILSCYYPIIAKSVIANCLFDIPIEHTVKAEKNIKAFSYISKVGWTYDKTIYGCDDGYSIIKDNLQAVNRSINVKPENGIEKKIYKVKNSSPKPAKIASQGDSVEIINDALGVYDIDNYDIDYEWYINNATDYLRQVKKN